MILRSSGEHNDRGEGCDEEQRDPEESLTSETRLAVVIVGVLEAQETGVTLAFK